MRRRALETKLVWVLMAVMLGASVPSLAAQDPPQDPTLNNLVHPPGIVTAPIGGLGRVTRAGTGPVPLVLVPSLGFGGDELLDMPACRRPNYRCVAITLAGFGGTPPPEMPSPGTSYADASWSLGVVDGIERLLSRDTMPRAVVLGHGALGGRIAIRFTERYPDRVAGLVLVGAEPARSLTPLRDLSPAERAAAVDGPLTRDWFRTVTRATWDANMWRPEVYSRDTAAAAARWREVAGVSLPTMIRYLSEFLAGDDRGTLAALDTPMLVIRPGFTPGFRADTANRNAVRLMRDGWEPALLARPNVEDHVVADTHFFVMFDRPDVFHGLLDGFVARIVSGPARQR